MRVHILRGLGSRSLVCGCFVGVYETYEGETVEIVEEKGLRCSDAAHREDQRVTHDAPAVSHAPHSHVA